MHAAALLFALALPGKLTPEDMIDDGQRWPIIEQAVDCVSVAHILDVGEVLYFWDSVQGEWTCIDHRWITSDMAVTHRGAETAIWWQDWSDSCYRCVRTKHYVETWEFESPTAQQNNGPWFARVAGMGVGLKKP